MAAFGIWLLLFFPDAVLEPNLGPEAARILATTTHPGAVVLAAFLWIGINPRSCPVRELLAAGVLRLLLTVAFEFSLERQLAAMPAESRPRSARPRRGRGRNRRILR